MKKKFISLFNTKIGFNIDPQYDRFKKNVLSAVNATPDGDVRGKWFLDYFDRFFRKLDNLTSHYIPDNYNPFTQAGAVANVSFMVALITGFILLIWYRPSVFQAYNILQSFNEGHFIGSLMRSLHRYSSDVCLLFVFFHAFKVFFGGRFTGSRSLAWITGIIGTFLIWFDGWLGYWLVWDERGGLVAASSARILDVIPIFAEPLAASFLTNSSFNSLLFFIVFFLHILVPLGFGIALWLHVSRLSKPRFFTSWKFAWVITLSMIVLSIVFPADLAEKANMLSYPESFSGDWYYLLPLFFTERLQCGLLWIMFFSISLFLISIPWIFKRPTATTQPTVDEPVCNGCTQCFHDCPYNAITMQVRQFGDIKKSEQVAWIDPNICVSCGICVGSCDPVAIDYPDLNPW